MPAQPVITTRGQGPDLVMLHGWGMNAQCWNGLADGLAESFTLHLVELPGHGTADPGPWQPREVVDAVLAATPRAHWLGWSLGGALAIEAVLRRPERVRRLVLMAVNPTFISREDWPHGASAELFSAFRAQLEASTDDAMERFLGMMVRHARGGARTMDLLRRLVLAGGAPDARALISGLDALEGLALHSRLPEIDRTTLWVCGDRDRITPDTATVAAAAGMGDARTAIIRGAGHAPFLHEQEQVLDVVRSFLARG